MTILKFFGAILITFGLLIIFLGGACTLYFISASLDPSTIVIALFFGSIPCGIGLLCFGIGKTLGWSERRDESDIRSFRVDDDPDGPDSP